MENEFGVQVTVDLPDFQGVFSIANFRRAEFGGLRF
jgi:hypothetical protein